MDRYEKWFIGIILFILVMLFALNRVHAGELFRPQKPPEKPPIIEPSKEYPLAWLQFENASSRPGKGSLQVHQKYTGRIKSLHINNIPLICDRVWPKDGSTICYGPAIESYTKPITAILTDTDGNTHTAVIKADETPSNPDNPPTGQWSNRYDHYWAYSWDGKGVAIIFCAGDKWDSVTLNGKALRYHGIDPPGARQVWTNWRGGMAQTGIGGVIVAKRGGKSFKIKVRGSRNQENGGCR